MTHSGHHSDFGSAGAAANWNLRQLLHEATLMANGSPDAITLPSELLALIDANKAALDPVSKMPEAPNSGRKAIIYLTCYSPRKGACWIIAGKSNNRHRWLRA